MNESDKKTDFVEEYLNRFMNYERKNKYDGGDFDPEKALKILNRCGLNPESLKIYHVAGTKGKGSVSVYLSRLLEYSGKRTGLFTSPHLYRIHERIRINGRMITDEEWFELVQKYHDAVEEAEPTYFEALTFFAAAYFIRQGCDCAVFETGLGGRLDATNFCLPQVSVITTIGYDHTSVLGNTLEKIAAEKSGIIKPEIPVVFSPQKPEAEKVIRKTAEDKKSPAVLSGSLFLLHAVSLDWRKSVYRIQPPENRKGFIRSSLVNLDRQELETFQIGKIQAENFQTALTAFIIAEKQIDEFVVRRAFLEKIKYRIEYEERAYADFIWDTAHNDDSFRMLFESVKDFFSDYTKPIYLYTGIVKGKELERISVVFREYQSLFKMITVFDFVSFRESVGAEFYQFIKDLPSVRYVKSMEEIEWVDNALNMVSGSFYHIDFLRNQ